MKIDIKFTAIVSLFVVSLISCSSDPDLSEGWSSETDGLLNVTIQIPDNPAEFYATKKGPYTEGEEILVKVPTTDEEPLDVSRLICTVSLQHNCYVRPAIGGELDFTKPYEIKVVDALGKTHTNTIRIVPTPPKTKFSKLWDKSCADLAIASRNNTGIAMNSKYLAVQEYNGPIYLYDRTTGSFVKTIDAASSFMMKIRTDDGGHFVTSRENVYGAGFMVFYYSETDNTHNLILNYTAGDGCPEDLGYNMNVIGDVTKGVSYIYGTRPGDMYIYYWKLQDGQLVTPANQPLKLRYGPAGGPWTSAPSIQRASLADDSEHYISYSRWIRGNDDDALKSRFSIFTPSMEITSLNIKDYEYRILGFRVFDADDDQYVAINDQEADQWAGGGSTLKVFDITNRSKMELAPDDDGYNNFCLFTSNMSDWYQNYFSWGDVAVYKEATQTGYDIYIAQSFVGFTTSESKIRVFKMSYYRQ
jgi:hypothetical protein